MNYKNISPLLVLICFGLLSCSHERASQWHVVNCSKSIDSIDLSYKIYPAIGSPTKREAEKLASEFLEKMVCNNQLPKDSRFKIQSLFF
jgi:hypothetical protein